MLVSHLMSEEEYQSTNDSRHQYQSKLETAYCFRARLYIALTLIANDKMGAVPVLATMTSVDAHCE